MRGRRYCWSLKSQHAELCQAGGQGLVAIERPLASMPICQAQTPHSFDIAVNSEKDGQLRACVTQADECVARV